MFEERDLQSYIYIRNLENASWNHIFKFLVVCCSFRGYLLTHRRVRNPLEDHTS